mmetsp:Transcript_53950/g.106457  ORF Transcript_53950/g.106457 Transcript_53950/m.106457 type:complete len:219 (-) Transcript_53950:338-994(-)
MNFPETWILLHVRDLHTCVQSGEVQPGAGLGQQRIQGQPEGPHVERGPGTAHFNLALLVEAACVPEVAQHCPASCRAANITKNQHTLGPHFAISRIHIVSLCNQLGSLHDIVEQAQPGLQAHFPHRLPHHQIPHRTRDRLQHEEHFLSEGQPVGAGGLVQREDLGVLPQQLDEMDALLFANEHDLVRGVRIGVGPHRAFENDAMLAVIHLLQIRHLPL